jgi:hypothetical protein
MRTEPGRPYWIDDGTESCGACTHAYVYEMEFRCVACDRGICCHCVGMSVSKREVLCPECLREEGDD